MKYLLLLLLLISPICAIKVPNPIFWERSFTMNITNDNSIGTLIPSTSNMVTCQDFQGIHLDINSRNAPDRIVFNFEESCQSSNMSINTIQQINAYGIEAPAIKNAQKIALVKRGNCKWSEKISVVNHLALSNNISITAVFIYDNITYGDNITISRIPVTGSGSLSPPTYPTPLPADRSVLNMSDNDLEFSGPSTTAVYFIPFIYGNRFVERIKQSYNASNPTMRQYWLLTPYLEEVSWGYSSADNFFATGRGYLSYIIALAAVFLIAVIFFRWWKIRRMRADYPNGMNGTANNNGFHMQQRVNHLDPLPVEIVNSLPIDTYSPDLIKNVNCAICLEDFVPGKNDIRILPCGHGFCVLCIDPWLTQKSTMCPICKWDCLPTEMRKERNLQQQQNNSDNAVSIDMTIPGPSTTLSTTNNHVQNHTDNSNASNNTTTISPPISSPDHSHDINISIVTNTDENYIQNSSSQTKLPFEKSTYAGNNTAPESSSSSSIPKDATKD
ncbi:uncharacterized protein BX663DRAFT_503264 [Cokeromyces recurvatus]|uniref:uncharacterized protein n=1 Tax=Cokeromyces recurvatus TaxID=90255 RepID=UPI00221F0A7D|nr:uncharacterized protein BX663DRAFT_503264 [Cokeromyces recurvatus]KAI7904712.1 hypothetical protein BX663DRAFT_503264 [Cokeromyces recurvatus]